MTMQKMIALTFAAALAATTLPVLSRPSPKTARSSFLRTIPPRTKAASITNVVANYNAPLHSLDGQFTAPAGEHGQFVHAAAGRVLHDRASPLHGGARLQASTN